MLKALTVLTFYIRQRSTASPKYRKRRDSMKSTNRSRRFLATVLVMVMLIAMLPVTVSAADTSRTADTIFFATDRHEETSKLQSLLKGLAYEPGLVVLGGDHVNNTNSGSLVSITSEIHAVWPSADTFYTYAAHDPNVSEDSSNPYAFARTGEVYEGEDYYVYGVDQDDMQSASNAATASAAFVEWAEGLDDGKMIFVMCHMPIHKRRNDNAGGATWLNALNKAGASKDIVLLWGHNHTGESSADTSVYFVARGGTITPQGGSATTIQFTYMNAGYIKNGYASMIVIDDESASVSRYNTSGSVTASYTIERLFGGHTHEWTLSETVDATCTEDGTVTYVCACGESYTDSIAATGEHSFTSVTLEATCTEDGSVTETCDVCGETVTTVLEAAGHCYEANVVDATCTEGGFTTYTCSVCGDTYVADQVAALGHSYTAVTTPATCVTDGSVVYTCVCGESYTEVISATGHSYESVVTEATCEAEGYTTYTCVCGDSYAADTTAALGHDYVTETVAATCTVGGYTSNHCARCGEGTVTNETEALGHVYTSVTTEADCVNDGRTTHTCDRCGDTYVSDVVSAYGHSNTSVVTEATCETAGYTTHTCSVCGTVTVDTHVSALGHDYVTETVAATCTEDGCTTSVCQRCGDSSETVIAALGHSWNTVTVNATCTDDGSVTTSCLNCGESTVETIAALGHSYTAAVTAPTCESAGCTTYTCATCADSYVTDETAALGHDWVTVTVAAACTKAGSVTTTCGHCGESTVETIPALGHDYASTVTAPTCEASGYTTHTCTVCANTYTSDVTAALGHSYTGVESDGMMVYTCDHCGSSYSEDLSKTYTRVSTISSGENYVITLYSGSKYYALSHEGNKISAVQVTVSNKQITSEITDDLVWSYNNGRISYEDNGTTYSLYASRSSGMGGMGGMGGSYTLSLSTSSYSTCSFSSSKLKIGSYYLRYSNGSISLNRSASTSYLFIEE